MNKKTMTILTLLAAGTLLTACGGNSSSVADVSSAAETTTASAETTTAAKTDTTAAKTETTTSAAAPETTAPADTTAAADTTKAGTENAENLPTEDEAKQVVNALGLLDTLYSGGIQKDMESSVKNEAGEYFKVTDSRFQSAAELRTFVSEYFADSFINAEYSDLLGNDKPLYADFEGVLYARDMARGGRYSFGNAPAVKVEKANGEGAVVQTEFDDMGAVTKLNISVEKTDGVWKITGVNIA